MHALRDRENLQKILERKVDLAIQGEEAQQKLYQAEAEIEAKKVGKAKSRLFFSRNQSRVWVSPISIGSSKPMGRSGSER